MFVAFEWTRDIKIDTSGRIVENVFEQDMEIPLTRQPEVAPHLHLKLLLLMMF